jgi:hypothetical protein
VSANSDARPGEKEVEEKRKDNDPGDHRFGSLIRAVTLPRQVAFDLLRAQYRKCLKQPHPLRGNPSAEAVWAG